MSRVLDVVIGVAGLVWLAPLFMCAALLVMVDGAGPVIDRQACPGPDGRRLALLRFRTLRPTATGAAPASRSRIGHVLWVTRIADIPLLISLVKGEFSLFGAPETAFRIFEGLDWRGGEGVPLRDLAAVPLAPGDPGGAAGTPAA